MFIKLYGLALNLLHEIQDYKTFIYIMTCINIYKNTYNLEYQTKPENWVLEDTTWAGMVMYYCKTEKHSKLHSLNITF